ncbi:outer membrane lipoprotein chaperone LolA [Parasulfuritortus cantonensis]|uniref:Outer-membrane lipoprotein carrier protein n=1 Tax=Parasulfuritortus cantonensis TaxID=2528202 RepID=A0A4R1BRF4_9PROT|nr:outer membrane lipoprotein chaperone LolA [Parasulfuritortus cantonensis]TCJ20188.1 outer membrane lipoprotein chaperone LolA [Parasulfuritortus cantonensis]
MTKPLLAALAALVFALPAPARADAIQRLHDFAGATRTLSGTFNQVVRDRNGRKTQETSGELYFSRPGKFRWVYRKPYEQLIVGDGVKIWIYDADLEQVTVKKLDRSIGESPAALLAGSNDLDKYFVLSDGGSQDGIDWLEATPKGKEGTFERVRLGFRANTLVAMELRDNFGQRTDLTFSGMKNNPPLAAELFRFKPPKGADVLGDD